MFFIQREPDIDKCVLSPFGVHSHKIVWTPRAYNLWPLNSGQVGHMGFTINV